MISGVGTDIESVTRLKRIWELKPDLLKRFFFSSEFEYAQTNNKPWETLTGIWCAKKSVLKSLGSLINIKVSEVEIFKKDSQYFEVVIHNKEVQSRQFSYFISISHSKEYSTAVCISEIRLVL